jgi:purine-binding chemotaxis protein CheW
MEQDKQQILVAEKDALSVYFEALLREAPPELDLEALAAPQPVAVAAPVRSEGRPAWGDDTFQALLFKVGGLTLAVPLVELTGVQEWRDGMVTPLPGHVPWYLGLMQYRDRSVPVVDTAQLVMPEDRQGTLLPWQERLRHVVLIGDGSWGLACDELAQVVTLRPDEVRWRTSRTRRRWLAGTVIEHMCALLDPPVFADVLASGLEDAPEAGAQDEERGNE